MYLKKTITAVALSVLSSASQAFLIDVQEGRSPDDLANILTGSGVTVLSSSFSSSHSAPASFSRGFLSDLDIQSGVILSSGSPSSIESSFSNPNSSSSTTTSSSSGPNLSTPELSDIATGPTYDTSVLSFDFQFNTGYATDLSVNLIFGSEGYNEFVGSSFDDVIGVFVDGVNIATLDDGSPVSVNTINNNVNSSLFNDNSNGTYLNEMDGFTSLLTFDIFDLGHSIHNISFQIADVGDSAYDSWLLIESDSISANKVPELSASSAPISAALLLAMLGLGVERRRKAKK